MVNIGSSAVHGKLFLVLTISKNLRTFMSADCQTVVECIGYARAKLKRQHKAYK